MTDEMVIIIFSVSLKQVDHFKKRPISDFYNVKPDFSMHHCHYYCSYLNLIEMLQLQVLRINLEGGEGFYSYQEAYFLLLDHITRIGQLPDLVLCFNLQGRLCTS